MGILDELSSATGVKESNKDLMERCLKTPALLHSVAEGLRTGTPKARQDCAEIMALVAEKRADLVGSFVTDFLDASKQKSKPVAKLAFKGLVKVVHANPAEVYAERDYLLEVARQKSSLSPGAAGVLSVLCGNNPNYRGKLLGSLVRLLNNVPDKDLPKWVGILGPAVAGSQDSIKRLTGALEPRRPSLDPALAKRLEKTLVKLERTAAKPAPQGKR